jgi:uncharacterized protein DUF2804
MTRVGAAIDSEHTQRGLCTEPEITGPVLECRADGHLNRQAVGWSRRPLHRCNLSGHWPRKKRWDYWCVTTDTHLLSLTYADVDYLGVVDVWLLDYATRTVVERGTFVPFAKGFALPETVGGGEMRYESAELRLGIREESGGTRLLAGLRTRSGVVLDADLLVALPPGHETLNVVIPWSDARFQFTSKHNTRPARGTVVVDGKTYAFGPENHAFGCLDYGRGVWPYRCVWNWASASGVQDGRTIGLNLGGQWTDGTGMTENGLCIDGRLHKLSEELVFTYDRRNFMAPWRIRTPISNRVDLTFTPFFEKQGRLNLLVLASETHVCFGSFAGHVVSDDAEMIHIRELIGWSEEHRAKW